MIPTCFSTKASNATPPSDDNHPPSQAEITFCGLMTAKENGSDVSSDIADVAGPGLSKSSHQQRIRTPYQNLGLYT
jgi:hypothetical protein